MYYFARLFTEQLWGLPMYVSKPRGSIAQCETPGPQRSRIFSRCAMTSVGTKQLGRVLAVSEKTSTGLN